MQEFELQTTVHPVYKKNRNALFLGCRKVVLLPVLYQINFSARGRKKVAFFKQEMNTRYNEALFIMEIVLFFWQRAELSPINLTEGVYRLCEGKVLKQENMDSDNDTFKYRYLPFDTHKSITFFKYLSRIDTWISVWLFRYLLD